MTTSEQGVKMIASFEGCRLVAYRDVAGVPTIGFGHVAGVQMGDVITKEQAINMLKKDLKKFEKHVNGYNKIYNFTQYEFDALVSFAFNIGNIKQLTASGTRSKTQIAAKMLLYVKAGGKRVQGLVNRRQKERNLFVTGGYPL